MGTHALHTDIVRCLKSAEGHLKSIITMPEGGVARLRPLGVPLATLKDAAA